MKQWYQELARVKGEILDGSQSTKLAAIAKTMEREDEARFAIGFGLIREQQWPITASCPYRTGVQIPLPKASDFAPTPAQLEQIQRAWWSQTQIQRVQAQQKPPRDFTLGFLNPDQKAKLAAFENDMQLAREALGLGLIPQQLIGIALCG
jgi:hypothetical protein